MTFYVSTVLYDSKSEFRYYLAGSMQQDAKFRTYVGLDPPFIEE